MDSDANPGAQAASCENFEEMDGWLTAVLEHIRILLPVPGDVLAAEFVRHPVALKDLLERCEQGLALYQDLNRRCMELNPGD